MKLNVMKVGVKGMKKYIVMFFCNESAFTT